jgi:hypothetical protein
MSSEAPAKNVKAAGEAFSQKEIRNEKPSALKKFEISSFFGTIWHA